MANEPPDDPQTQEEALEYWGYLIRPDKCATDLLNRLLVGIATFIAQTFQPTDSPDLLPAQLADFYRAVGGDYDPLFKDADHPTIAYIYKALGCLHSLQPESGSDGYGAPTIPALKKQGFVRWQTVNLLLGPEEHVGFLQSAVQQYDIIDPDSGAPFPKILPKEAFPEKPDDDMVEWYNTVYERLRQEAESAQESSAPKAPMEARTSGDESEKEPRDKRTGAAAYFRNPFFRNNEGRPTIVRSFARRPGVHRTSWEYLEDRGGYVTRAGRQHIRIPQASGRSYSNRYDDDDHDLAGGRRQTPSPRPPRFRREFRRSGSDSVSSTSSESDSPLRSPPLRHRRSEEPPCSPREYFSSPHEHGRRHSEAFRYAEHRRSDPMLSPQTSGFKPTKAPIFAAEVARMQAQAQPQDYFDKRAPIGGSNYPRPSVRYGSRQPSPRGGSRSSPRDSEPPAVRVVADRYDYSSRDSSRRRPSADSRKPSMEREREREMRRENMERHRDSPRTHRYVAPEYGVGSSRRYPVQAPRWSVN